MDRLRAHHDLFRTWDVAINPDVIDRDIGPIASAAKEAGVPLVLSRLRSIDEQRAEAGKYYHSINQGFLVSDAEEVAAIARLPELDGVLAGVVFRLTLDMPVWETVEAASAVATSLGLKAHVHMRMAGTSPASPVMDDALTVRRIAEAMAAAMTFADVTVFADTLVDIDRGYFPPVRRSRPSLQPAARLPRGAPHACGLRHRRRRDFRPAPPGTLREGDALR